MKKILLMCLADATINPRPSRFIHYFESKKDIIEVIGLQPKKKTKYKYFKIKNFSGFKKYFVKALSLFLLIIQKVYKNNTLSNFTNNMRYNINKKEIERFAHHDYDYIFCEDLQLLPIAVELKRSAKLVFDAREIYAEQNSKSLFFRFIEKSERERMLKQYLSKCDIRLTVNDKIKDYYELKYGLDFHVIFSTPLKSKFSSDSINKKEIKLVHHGLANKNRHIENMILACNTLPKNFYIDFYLTGSQQYIEKLKSYIRSDNVKILPPVDFEDIAVTLSGYDVGIYLLKPENLNLELSLPNKFFEYINSGLALCTGPSPVMSEIIKKNELGLSSKTFSVQSFNETIKKLNHSNLKIFKENSRNASKIYNWSNQEKILSSLL